MPRISGRSGSTLDWPMPRRPRARSVPRCLGLVLMELRVWVTRRVASAVCFLVRGVLRAYRERKRETDLYAAEAR